MDLKKKGQPETVDRIYGKEFEYDQNAKVIRSDGEVHIDLQAPIPTDAHAREEFAAGREVQEHEPAGDRVIHVKTSGLVYMQQMGIAATGQEVEFEVAGLKGKAKGAEYSSDTGVLILQSDVHANGLRNGQPVELTANHAELDRQSQVAVLTHARYVTLGGRSAGETIEAEKMTAHLRKDGSIEQMDGSEGVRLSNKDGGFVTAPEGEARMSNLNRAESMMLRGGVRLVEDGPERQVRGEAVQGVVGFDKQQRPVHVVITGAVHLHERQRTGGTQQVSVKKVSAVQKPGLRQGGGAWIDRDLTAESVELALGADAAGKVELRDAKAVGKARVGQVTDAKAAGGKRPSSSMAGDLLTAHFLMRGRVNEIDTVHGVGHTELRRIKETGVEDTSSGDSLDMSFRSGNKGGSREAQEIASATQQGNVVMTHKKVAKPGDSQGAAEQRATATQAAYDGDTDKTTLTGTVQLLEEGRVLWADRVVIEQQTGDAVADGPVKASYEQPGNAEPVHVLAARAELKHDAGLAFFYGAPGGGGTARRARLWQGGSQVEAPVLQFDQKKRSLVARGDGAGADRAVHTVLLVNRSAKGGQAKSGDGKAVAGKGVSAKAGTVGRTEEEMRVVSRELVYSDVTRTADFTGGVEAVSEDGRMRARQATVYLQAAAAGGGKVGGGVASGDMTAGTKKATGGATPARAGQSGFMGGSVERMVATGGIEIEQPGRQARGEQLVYTAEDQMFVLTGTAASPPKMMDETRGSTTGASLRFHTGDNSVVVSNEAGDVGRNVRTETRVKQKP